MTVFARCIYRVAELSGGFQGKLANDEEVTYMVLEGAMIVIASIALTVPHPGIAFKGYWVACNFPIRGSKIRAMEAGKLESSASSQ